MTPGPGPEASRDDEDVTNIAPAERHVIEFAADADPGGTLTGVVYESAMNSDVFGQLMEYAGYEG